MIRSGIRDRRSGAGRFPCVVAALFWCLATGLGADKSYDSAEIDAALKRGTGYLLSLQDSDGGIHNKERNETAMTSLSVLALAACGHQPSEPTPEGRAMRSALEFVLRPEAQSKDGYFGMHDGSRMYGHGITTLMLVEMLGMGADSRQDALIHEKCRRAVELILRAQRVPKSPVNAGGWRYTPETSDSDLSVTVWQTMALRAAKNAGFDVPKQASDDAVRYIKGLYEPESEERGRRSTGGFGYSNPGHAMSTTAEGLLALQVCGEYTAEETIGAADRLLREGLRHGERWFFYTTYYYAQGMYQRGGRHAAEAERLVPELLLPLQAREGWWEGRGGEERQGGKVYATALAMLALSVHCHYLPIYQR